MVKEVINHFRSIPTPEGGVPRRAESIHNSNNKANRTVQISYVLLLSDASFRLRNNMETTTISLNHRNLALSMRNLFLLVFIEAWILFNRFLLSKLA